MPTNPLSPIARGFAGPTTLLTSWGACRLHDLARLTARRDAAVLALDKRLVTLQQAQTKALAAFDNAAAQTVKLAAEAHKSALQAANDEARASIVSQYAEAVSTMQATGEADIAGMLPLALPDEDGEPTPASVTAEPETVTDVVDVTIGVVEIEGQAPHAVVIRCTPDCVFVTESGDVAASDLLGASIVRVLGDGTADMFVVPAVVPVTLDAPIPVYRVCPTDANTCCVGADSMFAAVVRC